MVSPTTSGVLDESSAIKASSDCVLYERDQIGKVTKYAKKYFDFIEISKSYYGNIYLL
jgi:hypothetical protein